MIKKKTYAFTLSDEAKKLLKEVADSKGISQTAVLELLIRQAAKDNEVKL